MHRAVGRCRRLFFGRCRARSLVAFRSVKASQQPIVAAGRHIDLMQTAGLGAKRTAASATQVLEVQHDPPRIFKVARKTVFGFRRSAAHSRDGVLNFGGKIADMMRVPAIFGCQTAASEDRRRGAHQHRNANREGPSHSAGLFGRNDDGLTQLTQRLSDDYGGALQRECGHDRRHDNIRPAGSGCRTRQAPPAAQRDCRKRRCGCKSKPSACWHRRRDTPTADQRSRVGGQCREATTPIVTALGSVSCSMCQITVPMIQRPNKPIVTPLANAAVAR